MAIDEGLARHFENHRTEILARLRSLAARLHEHREPFYHLDLVFSAALRRAFSLTRGFFDLVATENYVSAAPLVRLQLDNAIRSVAVIHVADAGSFIRHVASGKRIDQLRDKDGQRLTDKYIVDHLVKNESLPWVRRVYHEGSRFVHLSDVHLFGLVGGEGQLLDREPLFGDSAFLTLVEAFVMATELFDVYLEYWLKRKASPAEEVPPKRIPPKDDSLTERLKVVLRDHGLITCSYNDLVFVDGRIVPGIRASANPVGEANRHLIQLDIEVVFDEKTLCESFVGLGETEAAAIDDALHNFEIGVLPVMRTALWERMPDDSVVTIERWTVNGTPWKATIGADIIRGTNPKNVRIPGELNETIKRQIAAMTLTGDTHWLRLFYSRLHEEVVVEVLFDNLPLSALQDALCRLSWQPSADYYSLRRFLILQSQSSGTESPRSPADSQER